EGEKVEARYKGRGKYYKGKIAYVHSDGTFDINYDDGENEKGLAQENIRPLESARSSKPTRGDCQTFLEGDKVEANYRGKGRYHRGRVAHVNLDGTFNINYDDGEKERDVSEGMIRSLNRSAPDETKVARSRYKDPEEIDSLRKGHRVEARYKGRGKYYVGKISRVNSDGTVDIDYDDGEKERGLGMEHIKSLESRGSPQSDQERAGKIRVGDEVEANYRGKGRYYKGRVTQNNLDGTFNIIYDDGDKESGVPQKMVCTLEGGTRKALMTNVSSESDHKQGRYHIRLSKGDKVEAQYRGRGKFYKGKIARVNSNGTFDINYDDGEKEMNVQADLVKSLESARDGRSSRGGSSAVLEGDKVEANYYGKGRYYKGRVARVNLDGTFNIDYDDGEKEKAVPQDMVRALDGQTQENTHRHELQDSDDDRGKRQGITLREGNKVEARYRGRGKYYKGKITRVNSDGTFDIHYNDGEKERGVAEDYIKPLDSDNERRSPQDIGDKLGEGDKVEARYRGRGKYYRGKISRVNSDNTFDINYDDGEKDIGLSQEHIRPLESQGSVRSPGRNGKMREGDKVEARYRGRGKYYRGKISRVNSDDTFDINYDDG
ncbi:unnamed protein product, partial [Choristocarpus tenellus]